jgi:GTP cyclohydrolase II
MTDNPNHKRASEDEIKTVHEFGRYEVIGPVTLPLELREHEVAEFAIWYFSFPGGQYAALVKGDISQAQNPLVRVESICVWGHIFRSEHCDCGWQFEEAKQLIAGESVGIAIFAFDQHGKAVGLRNHFLVYAEGQRRGLELVVDAYKSLGFDEDYRNDYNDIADILRHFRATSIRLLSNNPERLARLTQCGITVERMALEAPVNSYNERELLTKKLKLGHLFRFELPGSAEDL